MTFKTHFVFLFITALGISGAARAQDILPLEALKPGMIATAETVFRGDSIETFDVEIIDILRNFFPQRNLIIVRLRGKKPEFTGPVAGMSGSPVYYDGKIIGALSYSLGNFLKEPLMGVTPIAEMLEIFAKEKQRSQELASRGEMPAVQRFLDMALGLEPLDEQAFVSAARRSTSRDAGLDPLPLPLQLSGFSESGFALAKDTFAQMGFVAVRSGTAGNDDLGGPLVPGAPIAAVLLHGDMDIAATGTVTYRHGDQVLAFGHPFFDNGPIELPIARAHILTTISSSLASQKLAITGKIVGSLRQDRTTGVMGRIGPVPDMAQIDLQYHSENGDAHRFQFSMAQEKSLAWLTPLISRLALISSLQSARLGTGQNSLVLKGSIELEDGQRIGLDNLFPGYQPLPAFSFLNSILHSSGQVAATLAAISNNPFRYVKIKRVELNFRSIPGRQSAELESIWSDRTQFEPGDTLEISYRLRPYQGQAYTQKVEVVLPESIQGRSLTVVVGGAAGVNRIEKRLMPTKFSPKSYEHLLRMLQDLKRNDRLYIQVRLADRGVVVEGTELPGMPPSVLPVFTRSNSKNSTAGTRDRVIREIAIPQSRMIEGVQTIRLRRKP